MEPGVSETAQPGPSRDLYSATLELQEQAVLVPETQRDAILRTACEKYAAILEDGGATHAVHYNWGVALSDRAKLATGDVARKFWEAAGRQYEAAVNLDPTSAQALNNWALALQQVAALSSPALKSELIDAAVKRFLTAIYLQPQFHRAVYNLGTAVYGYAQEAAKLKLSRAHEPPPEVLQSVAATYITLAAAMDPDKQVYQASYRMLQGKLRLPALLAGPLLLHTAGATFTATDFRPQWRACTLDAAGLHLLPPSASRVSQHDADAGGSGVVGEAAVSWGESYHTVLRKYKHKPPPTSTSSAVAWGARLTVAPADIWAAEPINDLAMPQGPALWVGTRLGGLWLVADSSQMRDCWLVSLRAVARLHQTDGLRRLHQLLNANS